MTTTSRVGTITDPLKGRVVTDEYLNKVDPGSPEATFVWAPADLALRKARREQLGLGTEDQALKSQKASHAVEVANAERELATLEARVSVLREAVEASASKSEAKHK